MLVTMQTPGASDSILVYFNSTSGKAETSHSNPFPDTEGKQTDALELLDRCFAAQRVRLETRARRRVGREDAEDLVGQCYLEARKSLWLRRTVQDLSSWLTRILDNLIRLHFRRMRIRKEDAFPEDPSGAIPQPI